MGSKVVGSHHKSESQTEFVISAWRGHGNRTIWGRQRNGMSGRHGTWWTKKQQDYWKLRRNWAFCVCLCVILGGVYSNREGEKHEVSSIRLYLGFFHEHDRGMGCTASWYGHNTTCSWNMEILGSSRSGWALLSHLIQQRRWLPMHLAIAPGPGFWPERRPFQSELARF